MPKRATVHIFVGAPKVFLSDGMEEYQSVSAKHIWKETRCVYKDKVLSLHNSYHQNSNTKHNQSDIDCILERKYPKFTSVSNFVSSTVDCQINPNFQERVGYLSGILHDCLDPSFPAKPQQPSENKSERSSSLTANTEFLNVFTSSQVALHGPGGFYGQTGPPVQTEISNCVFQLRLPECADGSLEGISKSDKIHINQTQAVNQITDPLEKSRGLEGLPNRHLEGCKHINHNCTNCASKRPRVLKEFTSSSRSLPQQRVKKHKPSSSLLNTETNMCEEIGQIVLKWCSSLVLLKYCTDKTKTYNILATVLHPSHLKEVTVRSGPDAGSSVPLATIVVLDQSDIECKVVMWRSAAFWTVALFPGDIVMLTYLTVCEDKWNEGTLLQSTAKSHLLNLGSSSVLCKDHPNVECTALRELLEHVSSKHQYLRDIPPRQPQKLDQIPYVRLAHLRADTLVHSILKVQSISVLIECMYNYKGQKQNKIVLTVEEAKGHNGTLVLWGASVSWCDQIRLKKHHVWEFRYLLTHKNSVSGDIELHTTPWSSCECLFDDDRRSTDFKKLYFQNEILKVKQMDLDVVLEERYSGEVLVNARIKELKFLTSLHQHITMDHKTCLTDILVSLPDITYTGCAKCQRELKADANDIYLQCLFCLPFNQVKLFYRPAQITITHGEIGVSINVPPDILQIIFLNISPNLLDKVVLCSNNVTYGMVVSDLCYSLLAETGESFIFKIRSNFVLDENSIPLQQEFNLLEFHLNL
ncbi:shieldin complex subunit 2 [Spea bombifrons]|uniref:shieldin complex subunit 2 n=1 Tax=Spea bombifrons TaxID=233779 RepID=UPI00234935BF|nr:shieldin complex subunit 2 [Spea bombifrons]